MFGLVQLLWISPYCLNHKQVVKKFSEWKQVHVGMEPPKTSQTRWEWHHNTFTPSLHLVPFCQVCLAFVVCTGGLWKAVEWVVLVCSACWCAWRVCCIVGGCNLFATEYGRHARHGLSYMQKGVEWAVLSALLMCSNVFIVGGCN